MRKQSRWKFEQHGKIPKLKNPVFIEGLPGIGNVGKIVVDFMIDELSAVKLYDVYGHSMPNSVFVNEKNLVELPKIEVYYKKTKNGKDLLLLSGDVQPIDEESTYEFCEDIITLAKRHNSTHIITLGGIGLGEAPKKPKVFCTGNSKKLIEKYKTIPNVHTELYGVVGPIVGVSGLLIGLSEKQKLPAITLLSETLGHPMYLGVKAARETLKVLNTELKLKLDTKKLDKEIADLDREMRKTEELSSSKSKSGESSQRVNYIG